MPSTSPIAGATVLVTGAARGMGELYARRAASEGAAAIALWDVDVEAAREVAEQLGREGCAVRTYGVDISRQENIAAAVAGMREDIGAPDVLINNAGIIRGVPFWEHDPVGDIDLTMRINANFAKV